MIRRILLLINHKCDKTLLISCSSLAIISMASIETAFALMRLTSLLNGGELITHVFFVLLLFFSLKCTYILELSSEELEHFNGLDNNKDIWLHLLSLCNHKFPKVSKVHDTAWHIATTQQLANLLKSSIYTRHDTLKMLITKATIHKTTPSHHGCYNAHVQALSKHYVYPKAHQKNTPFHTYQLPI